MAADTRLTSLTTYIAVPRRGHHRRPAHVTLSNVEMPDGLQAPPQALTTFSHSREAMAELAAVRRQADGPDVELCTVRIDVTARGQMIDYLMPSDLPDYNWIRFGRVGQQLEALITRRWAELLREHLALDDQALGRINWVLGRYISVAPHLLTELWRTTPELHHVDIFYYPVHQPGQRRPHMRATLFRDRPVRAVHMRGCHDITVDLPSEIRR